MTAPPRPRPTRGGSRCPTDREAALSPTWVRVQAALTTDRSRSVVFCQNSPGLIMATLSPHDVTVSELAGEKIDSVINRAPRTNAAIGDIKVSSASGWFAARPSGTEDIYKIYAESFRGADQLQRDR